ncbi:hypothetical protein KL905_003898 [Ogataea polymorpha]|uniref:uncharacterized protein n=1 Tax=Ogataea polymorpha TaxID=460523 RepID=UPI0007F34FEA|nr:uncharacterized protein OGAPODRAFT_77420 [Ogataea polymorpha]KAG7878260.1 hypothetical protein KL937_004002 [Ogataea polymorpha]KAG7890223.1 hypothetical protein KL908_004561 [Ogataea polymorpha]KAG7895393.1 hypothetical protein KL936_000101 [Ogataea polymorpha]KAG7898615.1 hypothetical protein KL935_004214 [Ogataea polymorpha]KAG7901583.1 hypothetical protein KL907_004253 [Ogataea polymorpha]
MPYLGPRSFDTAPLTTNNLAYLNNKLAESHPSPNVSRSSSISTSPEETLSITTPLSTISSTSSVTDIIPSSAGHEGELDNDDNQTVVFQHEDASSSSISTITELKPSLLRKKSGELVKSSLKLPSLKRSSSMPNAKSVRFANRLEDIKFFDKLERPTAVSAEASPVGSPVSSPSLRPSWDFASPEEGDFDNTTDYLSEYWEILHNDVPHTSNVVNFGKFNSDKPIILESLKLNSTKDSLIGFVYVRNLGYEKKILIKLTFDDWNSFIEIDNANYISSNHIFRYMEDGVSYDKFSFIIKLRNLGIYKLQMNLKFCIKYQVNQMEYWENNDTKNYTVTLKKITKRGIQRRKSFDTDLDDIKFRLKTNMNFNDSFSLPFTTQSQRNFEPRTSKHYLLRKINSESAIPTLSSLTPTSCSLPPTTLKSNYSPPSAYNITPKSLAASSDPLYHKIIENYCFFGSPSHQLKGHDQVPDYADSFCLS